MRAVTYIIIGIIVLTYFIFNNNNTGNDIIDYPLRSFYHADIEHLIANCVSLFALSFMEETIGWYKFLFAIVFIWIVSSMILLIYHNLFPQRKVYTIGFSAVIYGLFVVYFTLLNTSPHVNIIGLVISIIPQFMAPGISYEGHIAGIIAGIIFVLLFPLDNKQSPNKLDN